MQAKRQMKNILTAREAKQIEAQKLNKYLTQWGAYARSDDGHFMVCGCGMAGDRPNCGCNRIISKD